jgi:3-oxoacyl-[acyl-carrier protein] reductase
MRSVLIVGASGTIGNAIARNLCECDMSLGLHYNRNAAAVKHLRALMVRRGGKAVCLQADLNDEETCTRLVDDHVAAFGSISSLVICFGDLLWCNWNDLNWDAWHSALVTHCLAPVSLTLRAIHYMEKMKKGKIVYLSSISPKYAGSAKSVHYAAAKGSLEIAMRGFAREVAQRGICINGVRAGFVLTPQQTAGRRKREIEKRIHKIPVGRAGKPEEIAGAVCYLLSDAADFITGELITVAGGD